MILRSHSEQISVAAGGFGYPAVLNRSNVIVLQGIRRRLLLLDIIKENQLNLMLLLSGICGMISVFVLFTKSISPRRRRCLFFMDIFSVILLMSDRFAYIYRGNTSTVGYYMVRISNFTVYFMFLLILFTFNSYLTELYLTDGKLDSPPKHLKTAKYASFIGIALVVISQFTGLYYYIDDKNLYQRSNSFIICYLVPVVIIVLQLLVIIKNYDKLPKMMSLSLILFTTLPLIASVLQIFTYGISLTNITMVGMVVVLYIFAIVDMNSKIAAAAQNEIEMLKNEQKIMRRMVEQTAFALSDAIDAKDEYTHGHSERVAQYSEMIAYESGKDAEECREIYIIALLHDVGKIGVPRSIINKTSKLTDEEYEIIKSHTTMGYQILSKITEQPTLNIGAHYHHERYDGKGYPEGLKGEEIPEIARIIGVADAYDAMSSKRSYRDALPQEVVRSEIEKGLGTQFDPKFGKIMLRMIDEDVEYQMREK